MSKKLELYYYPECPYCQRVLNAMRKNRWEGIELKNIHADAEADATLVRVGGKHQVPCRQRSLALARTASRTHMSIWIS